MINLNELFNKEIGVKMNWNTNEKQNESGSKIENQNGIEDRNRKSEWNRKSEEESKIRMESKIEDQNGIENRKQQSKIGIGIIKKKRRACKPGSVELPSFI